MQLSAQGTHEIASFEGFVPTPYNDSAGNATIGYGHLLHRGPVTAADLATYGAWTVDRAVSVLHADCEIAVAAVNHAIKVRLGIFPRRKQARFDQLVSLAYNIGEGAFIDSSLVRQINALGAPRNWRVVGPYWLEWDHAGGVVSPGLLNRRRAELAVFVSGKYPSVQL